MKFRWTFCLLFFVDFLKLMKNIIITIHYSLSNIHAMASYSFTIIDAHSYQQNTMVMLWTFFDFFRHAATLQS